MNSVNLNRAVPVQRNDNFRSPAFSNQIAMALAAGDPRFNAKQYDRPGMSRGGAQMNQAGIDSAQKMAQGIAQAYSNAIESQQYNANQSLQANQAQEQYAQALGGLNQQNAYAQQMAALQRQQTGLNFMGGILGELLS
jgi:hypothetical protein